MDNHFESKGGEQNIAQGDHAIGKQQITGNDNIISGTGSVTVNYGVSQELFASYVEELGVTKSALTSFFKILEQEQVESWELDSKLREIAMRHVELLQRFETVTSDDPEVQALKKEAGDAIKSGAYDQADMLLAQAKERDRAAVVQLKASLAEQQAALEMRQLSEAASCVEQAKLQRLQYNNEKSAQYYQEAAAALPEGHEWERATYLGAAGIDLDNIARYAEALSFYEQSLSIFRAIDNRNLEAMTLNNISQMYQAQGDYGRALEYLEQTLTIDREFNDKKGQGTTLNNIATIYLAKGDPFKALQYMKQSLLLVREIHSREGEGSTLNNIGTIHEQQGDYAAALDCYKQALTIAQEIKDKRMESCCLNNIGQVYKAQKNYDAALEYAEQSLAITRQIGDRRGEGVNLNNIGKIYEAEGDCPAALKQYEQALGIAEEIGNKDGEATYSWNIGLLYIQQGELIKAEPYLSRAVELGEQLERPDLEDWRKVLEAVRAKLREQR